MAYEKVAKVSDLTEGKIIPADVGGQKLLVTQVGGSYQALARKCTHMGADLCGGEILNGAIVCPKHGAAFDTVTGTPVNPAKILFLKMKPKSLQTYDVKVEGDDILVTVG